MMMASLKSWHCHTWPVLPSGRVHSLVSLLIPACVRVTLTACAHSAHTSRSEPLALQRPPGKAAFGAGATSVARAVGSVPSMAHASTSRSVRQGTGPPRQERVRAAQRRRPVGTWGVQLHWWPRGPCTAPRASQALHRPQDGDGRGPDTCFFPAPLRAQQRRMHSLRPELPLPRLEVRAGLQRGLLPRGHARPAPQSVPQVRAPAAAVRAQRRGPFPRGWVPHPTPEAGTVGRQGPAHRGGDPCSPCSPRSCQLVAFILRVTVGASFEHLLCAGTGRRAQLPSAALTARLRRPAAPTCASPMVNSAVGN